MLKALKKAIRTILSRVVSVIAKTAMGGYVFEEILHIAMTRTRAIEHRGTHLAFAMPNRLNSYRVDTFSTKEPETLEWIDSIPRGSVVWDIGANIGLYSCYSAKARDCRVFAFEPSVFNLELLARNIFLNGLVQKVVIVPLPLCEGLSLSTLRMTTTEWGGALSTFGHDYGWDGKKIQQIFEFQTLGLSMDAAVQQLKIPQPDYIKIDVDGIEHLILQGGKTVLNLAKGVLIEVNDGFHEQAVYCQKLLQDAGLMLKEKRHSEMFDSVDSFGGGQIWNQIWIRSQEQ